MTEETNISPAAVFLDRDGTIIEDRGHLRDPSEAVFFPDSIPALRLLQHDFALFIVTNQPGVAEGVLDLSHVDAVNRAVVAYLDRHGIDVRRVYVCPHKRSEGCVCIKPNPHYLYQAAREFGLDLSRSFVIGDHPHDVAFAANAGATGIYVLTGHGQKHREELPAGTRVAAGIYDAARLISETLTASAPPGRSGC